MTRRPGPVAATTAAVLVIAGLPLLGVNRVGVDASVLPGTAGAAPPRLGWREEAAARAWTVGPRAGSPRGSLARGPMPAGASSGTLLGMLGLPSIGLLPLAAGRLVLAALRPPNEPVPGVSEPPIDRCAVCNGVVSRAPARIAVRGFLFHRDCAPSYRVRHKAMEASRRVRHGG